jgi:hypothetical protein
MQKKLIECFSNVQGKKNAQEMLDELNGLKSSSSLPFIFAKDNGVDWLILGTVTEEDWVKLNLESDFMRI